MALFKVYAYLRCAMQNNWIAKAAPSATTTSELAQSLGVWTDSIEEVHAATLLAETKTKAGDVEFDRDSIWSVASEEKYAQFQFEDYVQRGQDFGWTF